MDYKCGQTGLNPMVNLLRNYVWNIPQNHPTGGWGD